MKWSSSFPTWVVFLSSRPPLACPRSWVKADKTPKYSVKHGWPLPRGRSLQCLLGNYGNNSAVRGEAIGPRDDEVRPESLRREEWWQWKQGGGVKVRRVGLTRCYPINPCCHIRGRWMYVDIPTDLSSSTIKLLMSDDDKCLSSPVICAALTDRRLVGWLVGRSKCVTVLAVGLLQLATANCCEPFYCNGKYWCGFEKHIGHSTILLFVSLLRQSENWERHRTKCSGGIWSIMGTCGPRDGGVHHYFQKLKSTSLYSLHCLTACTLWRQSLVWWITETETEQTQLLAVGFFVVFFCRRIIHRLISSC